MAAGDPSPLLAALYRGDQERLTELREASSELDVFEAAALGEVGRLQKLLDDDPTRATAHAPDGFTPLQLAAFFGRAETVLILLERGADPRATSRNEMRLQALHSAAAARDAEIAGALLDAGADPDARQRGGFTALHAAAQNGDEGLVKLLLDRGADPRARTDDGKSPADHAREGGHAEVVMLLRPPA